MMLKKIVKQMAPVAVYSIMSRSYQAWRYRVELHRLARMQVQKNTAIRRLLTRRASYVISRVLIVPSDPYTLIGALGDEAMIFTVVAIARSQNSDVEIDIIVAGEKAKAIAASRGLHPVDIWSRKDYPAAVVECLNARAYDALIAIGADSVDGSYVPHHSGKIILAADLAARSGIRAVILGFSISERMSPAVARVFDGVDSRLQLNVRDEISLARFQRFSRARANLVTDSAFLYETGAVDEETKAWIERNRAADYKIIGVNLHPLLVLGERDYAKAIEQMNSIFSDSLLRVANVSKVAWLLLPHDSRKETGDAVCLYPIMKKITQHLGDRVYYLDGIREASELKAVAGSLDGVVTGRMHLAIGALGSGTPTMSLTYFDKFEGLYRHFDLPDWLMLKPSAFLNGQALEQALIRFIAELDPLREEIARMQPRVIERSRLNFSVFTDSLMSS